MRSLEYKIKNNKVYFYDRKWEGIDRPDYDEIEAMDLGHAAAFVTRLQKEIDDATRNLVFPVNGHEISLHEMQQMIPVMQEYLKKYGIESNSTC